MTVIDKGDEPIRIDTVACSAAIHDVIKEAFYRTLSGQGEFWFPYRDLDENKQREYVDSAWAEFEQNFVAVVKEQRTEEGDQ